MRSLPGWGKLSTRLYSGEVPISKDKAMLYALVEADCRRPEEAPVVLWLTGWVGGFVVGGWLERVGGGWVAMGALVPWIALQLALRLVGGGRKMLNPPAMHPHPSDSRCSVPAALQPMPSRAEGPATPRWAPPLLASTAPSSPTPAPPPG